MAKPKKRAPYWMQDATNLATDPARIREILDDFGRKYTFVEENYRIFERYWRDSVNFNVSLRLLKRALRKGWSDSLLDDLNVELRYLVTVIAKQRAHERGETAQCNESDWEFAARKVVAETKPRRGRPAFRVLRHHVEGLVALMQETSGRPVNATAFKNSVYDPQVTCLRGQLIVDLIRRVTPRVSVTSVVNIILKAKARYATKPMSFDRFFPLYGARITPF